MFRLNKIYQAPPDAGEVVLGRTLPSLLDEACDRSPNPQSLNQWTETGWQSLSNQAFRTAAAELALGLLDLKLVKGDRVALLMHSDVNFCIADMGCLLTKLVDVPIDLTQTLENIIFILQHAQAKALIISNLDLLYQVVPYLGDTPELTAVIIAEVPADWQQTRARLVRDPQSGSQLLTHQPAQNAEHTEAPATACLCLPMFLCQPHVDRPCSPLPQCIQVFSLEEVRARGRSQESEHRQKQPSSALVANELATIIYIPGTTGQLQGVMLTHENLSANALAAFTGIQGLKFGGQEVALSFLPLTHVFARSLLYAHINYGHSIYLTTPNRVMKHLPEVKPTTFATVPLLLEKIYHKLLDRGKRTHWAIEEERHKDIPKKRFRFKFPRGIGILPVRMPLLSGLSQIAFNWALNLAKRYELGQKPKGLYALQLKLADRLVFSRWRSVLGGRLKYLISGGAALRVEVANLFAAAGIPIMQGYGLTESSSVICVNRGEFNRAGTVGVPIAGVQMAIADDGEILVKAPFITPGYYKNPEATRAALDEAGWLHTGDLGEFSAAGFLKLTGCKKNLFKLSTGKYVTPQPLESRLKQSPLVEQAIVVGAQRKFCAMLIFPHLENLRNRAQAIGIEVPIETLLKHPQILAVYQSLVDEANHSLPPWSTVKRFQLLTSPPTVENGLLTPTLTVRRDKVNEVYAAEIDALYGEIEGDSLHQKEEDTQTYNVPESLPLPTPSYVPVSVSIREERV